MKLSIQMKYCTEKGNSVINLSGNVKYAVCKMIGSMTHSYKVKKS